MAIAQQARPQQVYMTQQGMGRGGPSGLADVLEVLLDKGLVIDAFVRVSLVGIELLTIDARVVVASVDTYLRFAEAVNRLDLLQANNAQTLGDVIGSGSSTSESGRALSSRGSQQDSSPSSAREIESSSSERADQDHDTSSADESDERAASDPSSDGSDDGDASDDDKGILARIKERGQVF